MSLFTSKRERRLWLWTLAVIVAIYLSLGFAGTLAAELRARNLLAVSFTLGLVLIGVATLGIGLRRRPGPREVWVALGVAASYGMILVRMGTTPEERTHLFEYSLVAILIYEALSERVRNGRPVQLPAALAIGLTIVLGFLDEGIQAVLPNRIYDIEDVGFNTLAAVMGVVSSLVLARARRRDKSNGQDRKIR